MLKPSTPKKNVLFKYNRGINTTRARLKEYGLISDKPVIGVMPYRACSN